MVLEEAGLAVQLVNSSQARNLPGRPKTDKEDARWIARLTEMGMLRSSFVPPPQIRALRVYTRHVWDLTADRTRYWQRLEKLLEDALCKLTSVARLAGHQTARAVIEAMIAGERDPQVLAALGRGRMRNEQAPRARRGAVRHAVRPPARACRRVPAARHRPSGRRAQRPARAGHRAPGRDPRVLGRGRRRHHRPGRRDRPGRRRAARRARLDEIPGLSEDRRPRDDRRVG